MEQEAERLTNGVIKNPSQYRLIELEPNQPIHRKEKAEAVFLRTGDLPSYRAEPNILSTLGVIDAFLDRKVEAIDEAKRAVEMRPVSENAAEGPWLVTNLAIVYAWTSEPELAFRELANLVQLPSSVDYGYLKVNPVFDPLRNDPRFDKIMAQLAPKK